MNFTIIVTYFNTAELGNCVICQKFAQTTHKTVEIIYIPEMWPVELEINALLDILRRQIDQNFKFYALLIFTIFVLHFLVHWSEESDTL